MKKTCSVRASRHRYRWMYIIILPHVSAGTNVNGFRSKRIKFDMCTKENGVFQDVKFLLFVRFWIATTVEFYRVICNRRFCFAIESGLRFKTRASDRIGVTGIGKENRFFVIKASYLFGILDLQSYFELTFKKKSLKKVMKNPKIKIE